MKRYPLIDHAVRTALGERKGQRNLRIRMEDAYVNEQHKKAAVGNPAQPQI